MKNFLKIILVLPFFFSIFFLFGCKAETETEYITKTEYVEKEKQFVKTVAFTAEDVGEAGVKVTMSTATKGAKIYYTTDGIEPTEKNILYSSPVNFIKDVTVKAVAIKTGMENSPVAVATVSITKKTVTVEKEPDRNPPEKIILTENSVVAGNGKVLLSWKNPKDEDFYGTEISFTPIVDDVIQPIVVEGEKSGNSSILVNGLEDESEYIFSLVALDKFQNMAEPVTVKVKTLPDSSDITPPAEVSDLTVTPFSNRVKLEWSDPFDSDLFGVEVSWIPEGGGFSRTVSAMDEKSVFIAPRMEFVEVPFLKNGDEYQFTVKTMDVNGNKSLGVVVTSMPLPSEPLKIELSVPCEKSNTSIMLTANITNVEQDIKKVVCKKDGSESAEKLLSDPDAVKMSKDESNLFGWILEINATDESCNGTYTVAAIDSYGRTGTSQIKFDNFDFTPPEKVKLVSKKYESDEARIDLVWENPMDEDFKNVEVSYAIYYGNEKLMPFPSEVVVDTKKSFNVKEIGAIYHIYSIISVDNLGNKSEPLNFKVALNGFEEIPSGFVKWCVEKIDSFFMSDHPVTRAEYKAVMGSDPSTAKAYDKVGNELVDDAAGNNPVNNVRWRDAVVYCNKLSEKEGLTPCYYEDYKYEKVLKVCNSSKDRDLYCNFKANGYRLPTEAEWVLAESSDKNYKYAGSAKWDEVAWFYENTNGSGTREVKTKIPNCYGLYDMAGNVYEWCWDYYSRSDGRSESSVSGPEKGEYRCYTGFSFSSSYEDYNIFNHNISYINDYYCDAIGFRLVRSVQ